MTKWEFLDEIYEMQRRVGGGTKAIYDYNEVIGMLAQIAEKAASVGLLHGGCVVGGELWGSFVSDDLVIKSDPIPNDGIFRCGDRVKIIFVKEEQQ